MRYTNPHTHSLTDRRTRQTAVLCRLTRSVIRYIDEFFDYNYCIILTQTCIWSSRYHCHSLFLASVQSRLVHLSGTGSPGSVRFCKKKNRNAKNMASAGARAYMGVWGRWPQRGPGTEVRGSGGRSPPEAEGILLPKRANLSLSFKWNLKQNSHQETSVDIVDTRKSNSYLLLLFNTFRISDIDTFNITL